MRDETVDWHYNARSRETVEYLRPLAARAARELAAWTGTTPALPVHIVVNTDNDFTNGLTTVLPRNTIRLYPSHPRRPSLLQPNNDWLGLLLVHELLHVWHLDQHRVPATIFRKIFGRVLMPVVGVNGADWPAPVATFPNALLPDTLTEGYAVLTESRLMGGLGRANSPEARTLIRNLARDDALPGIGDAIGFRRGFPAGSTPYLLGGAFHDWLFERDPNAWRDLYDANARGLPPVFWGLPALFVWNAFPVDLWDEWRREQKLAARASEPATPPTVAVGTWEDVRALAPAPAGALYVTVQDGKRAERIVAISPDGKVRHIRRRHGGGGISVGHGAVWFDELLPFADTTRISRIVRLEHGSRTVLPALRVLEPDVGPAGIVAVQRENTRECLVILTPDGATIQKRWCPPSGRSVQQPRWDPDGRTVLAGLHQDETRFDLILWTPATTGPPQLLTRLPGDEVDAVWFDRDTILFVATASGRPELYAMRRDDTDARRLTETPTGVWQFAVATDGHLWFASPGGGGWTLRRSTAPFAWTALERITRLPSPVSETAGAETAAINWPITESRRYQAWRTLAPTGWQPLLYVGKNRRNRYGARLGGDDAVGIWHWQASVLADHESRFEGDIGIASTRGPWTAAARYEAGPVFSRTGTLRRNDLEAALGRFWRGANHRFGARVGIGGNWTDDASSRQLEYGGELFDESRIRPAWSLEPVQGVHVAVGGGSEISLRHGWRDGRIGGRFVTGSFLVGRVQWRAQAAGIVDLVSGHNTLELAPPGTASPGTRLLVGRGVPTTTMTGLTLDCNSERICGVERAGVASIELLLPLWWIQRGVRTLPLWFDELHLRPFVAGARFRRPDRVRDDLFAGAEVLMRIGLGSLALFEPLGVGLRWPLWPRRDGRPDVWLSTTISFDRQPLGLRTPDSPRTARLREAYGIQ